VPFSVAVLGPGETQESYPKRNQIRQELIGDGFEAFLPEEIVLMDESLDVLRQEIAILEDELVDFVCILNTSPGPGQELAAFADIDSIVEKSFLLCPDKYYQPGRTFPSDVIEQYDNRHIFSKKAYDECRVVRECISRARVRRVRKQKQLSSKQM
jgi:hypothetical protein